VVVDPDDRIAAREGERDALRAELAETRTQLAALAARVDALTPTEAP
ncbi:MAG: hypothetical protein HOQ43_10670, partial [Glycomyces artemisiae]|nr:hypothetical protein [Glycomyces artemisiae]